MSEAASPPTHHSALLLAAVSAVRWAAAPLHPDTAANMQRALWTDERASAPRRAKAARIDWGVPIRMAMRRCCVILLTLSSCIGFRLRDTTSMGAYGESELPSDFNYPDMLKGICTGNQASNHIPSSRLVRADQVSESVAACNALIV